MKPSLTVVHFGPGGAEGHGGMGRFLRYLLPALTEQGVQTRVVDAYGRGQKIWMPLYFAWAWLQLVGLGLGRSCDLVHIHMASYGSVVRKLLLVVTARILGMPVVLHLHGSQFEQFMNGLLPWARRWVIAWMRHANRVIAIGYYWQDYLTGPLGLPMDQVVRVPNGVPDVAREGMHSDATGPCRILALGELGVRKGTPELLIALASPALQNLSWHAVLAGNGPVPVYREQAEKLNLMDRLTFTGWVDQSRAWTLLKESQILVLPSHQEGLPMAILEAMAAGLTIVTTPVGAIPDAIRDDETGLLVPSGDPKKLAEALARAIGEPQLRQRLGRAARSRFMAEFTIEETARIVIALYHSVLQTGISRTQT
ncbi:Glycosyltransferase family 1 protein [Gammaproteobacteria bacterium]